MPMTMGSINSLNYSYIIVTLTLAPLKSREKDDHHAQLYYNLDIGLGFLTSEPLGLTPSPSST